MTVGERTPSLSEIRLAAADGLVWGLPLVVFDLVASAHPQAGRFYRLAAGAGDLAPGLSATHGDMRSSSALIDLSRSPSLLTLPDAHGAYLTLVIYDGWGRILTALGPRRDDWRGRKVVIAGPAYARDTGNLKLIRSGGDQVWAVCHILGAGEGGREDALSLEQGIALRSSDGVRRAGVQGALAIDTGRSFDDVLQTMAPASFFRRLAKLLARHPPPREDAQTAIALRRLGVAPGRPCDLSDWPRGRRQALEDGVAEGLRRIRWAGSDARAADSGGWTAQPAGARRWSDPLARAVGVLSSFGVPPSEDLHVLTTTTDADNRPLSGDGDYSLRFEAGKSPPVDAFWSLCLVDAQGAPLSAPFARLSVGDWFGIPFGSGEPFEVRIARNDGEGGKLRLEPPPGPFSLRLELYWPRREALEGCWRPPAPVNRKFHTRTEPAPFAWEASTTRRTQAVGGADVIHLLPKGAVQ